MGKKVTLTLNFQNTIECSPTPPADLYRQAASNDAITINSWRDTWIRQFKANHEKFGPFKDRSIGQLFNKHRFSPAIVVGSGPSLRDNAAGLLNNPGLPVLSCLHNFHFLEDLGVKVDYYVSLDSGPVTVEEVSEGGDASADYWAKTKSKTLLAYAGSHPELLERWQGEIYFFNAPIPDQSLKDEMDKTEKFNCHVSNGGNVLGAALYIAKAFMGCDTVIFMGADFSFSYEDKFHGWDSKYDTRIGNVMTLVDVYGQKVKTWPSYANFKAFFEFVAQSVPGEYINCSEGGCFGSYLEGNIRAVKQMELAECFKRYTMSDHIAPVVTDPVNGEVKILY